MNYIATLCALTTLAAGCTYELEGEFHNEIDPTIQPKITLSLNDLQPGSTITLVENTNFTFTYSIDRGILKTVDIYLDDQVYSKGFGSINDTKITTNFTLGPGSTTPGLHTLKIVITSTSGTGSIADVEGAEIRTIETSWDLDFITGYPPTPVLTLSDENGYLKVSWTPYTVANFDSYSLVVDNGYSSADLYRLYKDPSKLFFIDSSYVGGYLRRYTLSVNTKSSASASATAAIDDNVNMKYELDMSDTSYIFTWSKADHAAVFKSYRFSYPDDDLEITNINDTTFRYHPKEFVFGQSAYAQVIVNALDHNPPSLSPMGQVGTEQYLPGTKTFDAFYMFYNKTVNLVYGLPIDQNVLSTYSTDLEDLHDDLDPRTSIPFSGTTAYGPVDGIGVKAFDLNTKQVIDQLDLRPMTNDGTIYGINTVVGSTTAVVAVYYIAKDDFNQLRQYRIIYDMANDKVLLPKVITEGGALSGNGKYFISGNDLYVNNGSYFDTGWNLGHVGTRFRSDNPEEAFCVVPNVVQVKRSSDGALLRTIPVPPGSYRNFYDPVKHIFMFITDGQPTTYKCVDVESLQEYTIRGVEGDQLINGNFVNVRDYFFKAIK